MNGQIIEKPEYGNWIPKVVICIPLAIAIVLLALSLLWPYFLIFAALVALAAAFLIYGRHKLSPASGDVQESIWNLVLDQLDWDGEGRALDIGCGNGPPDHQAGS